MKKQTIIATLTGIMMLASASTAFAATDISKTRINDTNYTVINSAYNDAELLGTTGSTVNALTKAAAGISSHRETLKKKDSSAITGYVYAAYGWVDMAKSHYTTAQLEYRSGSGTGEVYASKKSDKGTGKVEAKTKYVQQVGEGYVYYSY